MLIVGIVVLAILFLNFWGFWDKDTWYFDSDVFFSSLVAGIMFYGVLGLLLPRLVMIDQDKFKEYEFKDQAITSLINKTEGELYGSFFLGCGSIRGESTDFYVAYAPMDKGDLRVKVDAYKTYVMETDSVAPVIKDYWVRKKWVGYKSLWFWNSKPRTGEWEK